MKFFNYIIYLANNTLWRTYTLKKFSNRRFFIQPKNKIHIFINFTISYKTTLQYLLYILSQSLSPTVIVSPTPNIKLGVFTGLPFTLKNLCVTNWRASKIVFANLIF